MSCNRDTGKKFFTSLWQKTHLWINVFRRYKKPVIIFIKKKPKTNNLFKIFSHEIRQEKNTEVGQGPVTNECRSTPTCPTPHPATFWDVCVWWGGWGGGWNWFFYTESAIKAISRKDSQPCKQIPHAEKEQRVLTRKLNPGLPTLTVLHHQTALQLAMMLTILFLWISAIH